MKKNRFVSLLFVLTLLTPVLSGCNRSPISQTSSDSSSSHFNSDSSSSGSLNDKVSYEIQTDIKKVYSLGETIDLSSSFILEKKGDEEIGRVSFDDASVSIDGIDTETEGNKTLNIRYENFHTEISYQVVTNYITLHLNGGRVSTSSENTILSSDDTILVPLYNDYADISSYSPVLEKDGETQVFTGWFYDAELTNRATYQQDTEITSEVSIDLYASYEKNSAGYFNYTINTKEKTCSIVSINFDQIDLFFGLSELVIPSEINGYPVTEIGQNIFVQYVGDNVDVGTDGFMDWGSFLDLSSISFASDSKIEKIGKAAFKNMYHMTSVTLPDSLKYIGDEAFLGCQLSSIKIPDNVEKIGKSSFGFNSLENVTFGKDSKLKILDENAFESNFLLYEIQLPESLQEIRDGVFENCNLIENLYLPKSVSLVSPGSFKVMNGLKSIEVADENPSFVSLDGNLYSKDKQKLIRYCLGKEDKVFTVPSFVKTIGDYAFKSFISFCYLEKVNLPTGLTYIGKEAFYGCTFDIDLPQSLNSFALGAFYDYKGKRITVDSQNQKYSSKDGILYSKDRKKLYACPCSYNVSDYVLDDQVEMICEYAFCDIETMNSFTVSENSALKEIRKDGILLASFKNLSVFDYLSDKIPSFYVNSIFEKTFDNINNFYLVLTFKHKEVKEAFAKVLPTDGDGFSNYGFVLASHDELVTDVLSSMAKFDYTSLDYYKQTGHLYLFEDFDLYNQRIIMNKLYSIYRNNLANEEQLGYFSLFEKYVCASYLTQVVYQNKINSVFISLYKQLQNRYSIVPSIVKTNVKPIWDKLNEEFPLEEDKNSLSELYNEILSFKLDENTFDKKAYDALVEKMNAHYINSRSVPNPVLEKITYLSISNSIYELLNLQAKQDISEEEVLYIYDVLNPSDLNGYQGGLVNMVSNYCKTEKQQRSVFGYQKYLEFLKWFNSGDGAWNSCYQQLKKKLKDFVFDPAQLSEDLSFYNSVCYTLLNRFSDKLFEDQETDDFDYTFKIYTLAAEIDIGYFLQANQSVDKDTLSTGLFYLVVIKQDLNTIAYYEDEDFTSENYPSISTETLNSINGYNQYLAKADEVEQFAQNFASTLKQEIDSFQLTKENLSSGAFEKLNDDFKAFGGYYQQYLKDSEKDSDFVLYYVNRYNIICASYLLNDLLSKYPSLNQENLIEFKKYYYGYFDFDTLNSVDGVYGSLDSFLTSLSDEDKESVFGYEQYEALLLQFSSLNGEADF